MCTASLPRAGKIPSAYRISQSQVRVSLNHRDRPGTGEPPARRIFLFVFLRFLFFPRSIPIDDGRLSRRSGSCAARELQSLEYFGDEMVLDTLATGDRSWRSCRRVCRGYLAGR